jgi:septal ring factor EnvC (AmiA/AmiB activator)
MTAEEEQAQLKRELSAERAKCARLEGELARERAENASLRQMLEEVLRRLSEVEGQLAKDSHNSSKPRRVMDRGASGSALIGEVRRRPEGNRGIPVIR